MGVRCFLSEASWSCRRLSSGEELSGDPNLQQKPNMTYKILEARVRT
jgi:hypothetical protein